MREDDPEEWDRRGFLDPPKWLVGNAAGLLSGALALAGVMVFIGAFVLTAVLLVGKVSPGVALPVIAISGALGILLLFLHRRAERFATADGRDPRLPRDRTIAFSVVREGDWVRQLVDGARGGFLAVHEDHVFVKMHRGRMVWLVLYYVATFGRRDSSGLFLVLCLFLLTMAVRDMLWRRNSRHPWGTVSGVALSGKTLFLRFAGPDGWESLALSISSGDRAKILPLLRAHVPVEEIAEPPKPAGPTRVPRTGRPAPPPKTAIDESTPGSLDRALEGMRNVRP